MLDLADLARLGELVTDQMDAVESGEVSGYGQPKADEMHDLRALLGKLNKLADEVKV